MRKSVVWLVSLVIVFALVPAVVAQVNFRVIHEFDGTSGDAPYGHLIYTGERIFGMTAGDTIDNQGMVFSIAPDGSEYTVLHHFAGQPGDGTWPHGSLLFHDNALFGMTWAGGCADSACPNAEGNGCGMIFSSQTDGSGYTSLHEFACGGVEGEGSNPNAHLISDGSKLYGTTQADSEYSLYGGGWYSP